jgi:hypothetical protein
VLDGVALVLGAAIASVHLRDLVSQPRHLTALGWGLVWITFTGVALSAAGPFLFLERRFGRRPPRYPQAGDWLWVALGLPWSTTALLRPQSGSKALSMLTGTAVPAWDLYTSTLWLSLSASTLAALIVVWKQWVMSPSRLTGKPMTVAWTDCVGLGLAIAWPLQWGFMLVVLG